jgi:hypothetical protein
MTKVYKSTVHRNQWVAYVPELGWVIFPARENGWEMRQPARGLDPLYLREVPARLAVEAGFPQPEFAGARELVKVA